jgi:hypothetical protein
MLSVTVASTTKLPMQQVGLHDAERLQHMLCEFEDDCMHHVTKPHIECMPSTELPCIDCHACQAVQCNGYSVTVCTHNTVQQVWQQSKTAGSQYLPCITTLAMLATYST